MNLFKGYVITQDKKCIEKFKNKKVFKTYDEVKNLPEFAGILAEDIILIDVDNEKEAEILYKIVINKKLNCRVYETSRGKHFLFKNTLVETCKIKTKLACGLSADIKLGSKNSYSILKYNGNERKVIYDTLEYEELPRYLLPIKSNINFLNMEAGEGRNQSLFNYILTLQSVGYSNEEARETIRIINQYILADPLDDNELDVILREEAFKKPAFFDGKTFLFDKFAKYLISRLNIIKIDGLLHLYKDGIYINNTKQIECEMIKLIPNLNKQKRNEVMSHIDLLIDKNSVVSPANYIAFKNGIYNIKNDILQEFNPKIIITNKINYNYNSDAYFELTDKTLNKLACKDVEIRLLLEECIGACMYRSNNLAGGKAFILTGDRSNGKSTFLHLINTLLGAENTTSFDIGEIGNRFNTIFLQGKLANIGDDISDDFLQGEQVATFKKIVTGESIKGEYKGNPNMYFFVPYIKLLFSANAIPRMRDKTGAVLRRLVIIGFNQVFNKDDKNYDPFIKEKLSVDASIEYLIKIGIEGLKRVLKNNSYTKSVKVEKELEEFEENNNPIIIFFKEIEENEILNNTTQDVYKKYNEFCLTNNFTPLSKIEFSKKITKYFNLDTTPRKIQGKSYRIFIKK